MRVKNWITYSVPHVPRTGGGALSPNYYGGTAPARPSICPSVRLSSDSDFIEIEKP